MEVQNVPTTEASKETILVVDDSSTNRFLLRSILQAIGYSVAECANGLECVEYCTKNRPGMVLLDVMMPEMDGIQACKILRQTYSSDELPIIMVTTKSDGRDIAEGLEAGANDYVTKPIDRTILLARLGNQFQIGRALRQVKSQRRELERALQIQNAMGDVLPEGILIHDSAGSILYSNQQLSVFCGEKNTTTIRETFDCLFDGSLKGTFSAHLEEVLATPTSVFEEEFEISGNLYTHVQIVSLPIKLSEESLLRLWVWRDVSQTREMERKILQRMKLDSVSLFAAGVAHNFNNIMGVILTATELLQKWNDKDPRSQRCLGMIQKSIEAGARFTKKMHAVAGRERSERPELADVRRVLDRVVSEGRARAAAVHFDLELAEALPRINLDTESVYDIFANVVSNAIDSMPDGGNIKISVLDGGKGMVEARVKDSGCGMDKETLQRIFEPFFSTKRMDVDHGVSMEGHGLGLWNVYYILRMAGGDVSVKSAVGKGTEVTLAFPAV